MKKTVTTFAKAKASGEKLTMLTAYDYSTAKLMDEAGVDSILVGDSLGNVVLGYEDTVSVTMEDMIHHTAAVTRGAKNGRYDPSWRRSCTWCEGSFGRDRYAVYVLPDIGL